MSQNNQDSSRIPASLKFPSLQDMTVSAQLEDIKNELAELRALLQPPRSIIITGSEVERVINSLKR